MASRLPGVSPCCSVWPRAALRTALAAAAIALMCARVVGAEPPERGASQPAASAPSSAAPPAALEETLRPIREKYKLPALCGAIVSSERLLAIGAVGVRRSDQETPVTREDRFHIGSCTKAMTATLCAELVQDGKLRWDMTIAEAFPDLREKMDAGFREVTLEQLLTNRGGCPADLSEGGLWAKLWSANGPPAEQRMMLVEGVVKHPPEYPPGSKFLYSNANFAIAGAMAERITKKPWEVLIEQRLFSPLGIHSAGFGAPCKPGHDDQPCGHVWREGKFVVVPPGKGDDNPAAIGPAGIVHMSIADWGRFVSRHLREKQDDALLKSRTLTKLHTAPEGDSYAFGWLVTQRPWGGTVLTHSGSNTMWFCTTWLAPEKGFAVLVMTNAAGGEAPQAVDEACGALIRFHSSHP